MRLKNHVAVVTGAASGIGREVALRFATEQARVVIVDQDTAGLTTLAAQIRAGGGETLVSCGSVDDQASVSSTIDETLRQWSRIDSLVAAAGISVGGIATQTSEADWDRVFSVNVKGSFLWCKGVLPTMMRQKSGSLITVASQLALAGGRNNASYVASKGAILSLTKSLALDYASYGIRANALVPAAIETPMLRRSFKRQADPDEAERRAVARHPLGRLGRAEEVAAAALFLASDESAFTTGGMLAVDGGWLAA
jgi:NAD(P)-dependent dehydrogenase (short-subunit alcohol dehydrogenase family)